MKSFLKVIQLHKNESQLIKKAIKHDREAQRILYGLHAPKMLSVCRYYIKDLQHAEEAMLNGFFKVFSNLNTYTGAGSFEGWIRKIMVRESISFLRQQKHVEFIIGDEEFEHQVSDVFKSHMDVAEIQQLIDDLPEGYRMVFVMYAIEGYKHHEISKILSISEGTSKSQLFKARKMLQRNMKKLNKLNYGTK